MTADRTRAATTPADPSEADFEAELELRSAPGSVYEALTTLQGLAGWWSTVTGDATAGGELRFFFGDDVPTIMRVDVARPAELVRWTCLGYAHLPEWAGTTITFALAPGADGGCLLSFRHHGLTPKLACWNDCKNGWSHFLPSLRDYVDTGTGQPWQSPADVERRQARDRQRTSLPAD
jgi:uncharacterized protein YndB with AHSA1/START domain